jgi:hypothetical protein
VFFKGNQTHQKNTGNPGDGTPGPSKVSTFGTGGVSGADVTVWLDACPVKLDADAKAAILRIVDGGASQG